MTTMKLEAGASVLFTLGMLAASPVFSDQSVLPAKPQTQSPASQSVQPAVDSKTGEVAAEKRQKLAADAFTALDETNHALKLLEEKKNDEALSALAAVTGKLELIVARDPKLALAPVNVQVITHDLLTNTDTVKAVIKEARDDLDNGEIQKARPLIDAMASEMVISTRNIPLATYPAAIKAVTPLIDAGKIDEAKTALQATLNTLVVTNEVIPLPPLRTDAMLKQAEKLAAKKDRTEKDNDSLSELLAAARDQLKLGEALGYGNKDAYKPMYEQIEKIEKQSAGGKSGTGWFDKIKQQVSGLMK